MNYKFFSMNSITFLKKVAPAMVIFVVVLGVLNFGSYDPYNELATLAPKSVSAEAYLNAQTLTVPVLATTPVFATPSLVMPVISVPTLVTPNISVPNLVTPSLSVPTLEVPSLTTPVLTVPTLSVPELGNIPSLSIPTLNIPSLSIPALSTPTLNYTESIQNCYVTASAATISSGSSVTISWSTQGFSVVTLNGVTQSNLTGTKTFTNVQANTTYTLVAKTADGRSDCVSTITVLCVPPVVTTPVCELTIHKTVNAQSAKSGDELTYTIKVKNTGTKDCTGGGVKIVDIHDDKISYLSETHTSNLEAGYTGTPLYTEATKTLFWNGNTLTPGEEGTIIWKGKVKDLACDTSVIIKNTAKTTAEELNNFSTWIYSNTVETNVSKACTVPVAKCDSFGVTPTSITKGQSASLNWVTTNVSRVTINNGIGEVAATGTISITPLATTEYLLTAYGVGDQKNTCLATVTVTGIPVTPTPITCEKNVTLSADASTINRGNSSTLAWNTTGITALSFDNGITATGLSGSTSVSPSDTTTYTLTATNGKDTIKCPVAVSVRTSGGGGGGGGSSAPRCELSVSDSKISRGDKVVLTWDSSRATDLFIKDKASNSTIITTENLKSSAKDRLLEGTVTVSPKKDTTYELTVKRGSSKRTCTVKVKVEDNIVVTQVRDQQPLVAGISLSQVPYTGFEAGPILTLLFYTLLMAWALYVAYLIVIRRNVVGGLKLATNNEQININPTPEQIQPNLFVAKVQAPVMPVSSLTPNNLPTGTPVVGYANALTHTEPVIVSSNLHNIDESEMTTIENYAHGKRILLSSDAIRHLIATTNSQDERTLALDQVITAAKAQFPAEDGWVVLNEKRMKDLCLSCAVNSVHSSAAPYVPAVIPEGAGSLAEAIVTGNVVAAYELIGNRPMFALADAAADLDAVYRIRLGVEKVVASELLMKETAALTDAQILQVIEALTSALDGTYTDEASAVKMSIMKAIKVVA